MLNHVLLMSKSESNFSRIRATKHMIIEPNFQKL